MALVLHVDGKTRIHVEINLNELINRLIEKQGVVDDPENDNSWISYEHLEEVVSEINSGSYFLIRNSDHGLGARKVVFNLPKDFKIYRSEDTSSGL